MDHAGPSGPMNDNDAVPIDSPMMMDYIAHAGPSGLTHDRSSNDNFYMDYSGPPGLTSDDAVIKGNGDSEVYAL